MTQMENHLADLLTRMDRVVALQRWTLGMQVVLLLAVLGLYFKGSL